MCIKKNNQGNAMKWVEIIELRSDNRNTLFLEQQLKGLSMGLKKNNVLKAIEVYSRAAVDSDFSIHLLHDSKNADINGSPLGLLLALTLKEFGLVSHKVWIEKYHE